MTAAAIAAVASAQNSAVPSVVKPEQAQAWSAFLQKNGRFVADWCLATGTPSHIWGEGVPLHAGAISEVTDARKHALDLLARERVLLGTGGSQWVEIIGQKVQHVHVFSFEQYFQNMKVFGGRADVWIHDSGGVSVFGSMAFPIPAEMNLKPAIAPNEAVDLAYAHKQLTRQAGPLANLRQVPPRLVLWGDVNATRPTTPRLAWEVSIDEQDKQVVGRAYVDARVPNVLDYQTDIHNCAFSHPSTTVAEAPAPEASAAPTTTVSLGTPMPGVTNVTGSIKAWLNNDIDPNTAVKNIPLHGVRISIAGGGFAYSDVKGNFDIANAGTAAVTVTASWAGAKHWSNITTATPGIAWTFSTSATPGTPLDIQVWTNAVVEFDKAQSNTAFLIAQIHEFCKGLIGPLPAAASTVTANVNVNSSCNATYSSGSNLCSFYRAAGGCVNTAYQTVVPHEWGHGLDNWYGGISQTEGMSEAWGDVMGTYVSGQPILGLNFGTSYPFIRTALNIRTRGSCTEVHCAGESWMGGCWDIREGLRAKLGSIAGISRAERIVIPAITMHSTTGQNAAILAVFTLDDNDANLANGTPNCDVLGAVCIKRNFTNPTGACGTAGQFTPYGVGCLGSNGVPAISNTGTPTVGAPYTVNLASAAITRPALLNLGDSNTLFLGFTLPLDLGPYGATDCFLRANAAVTINNVTSATGTSNYVVNVPPVAALLGGVVYHQWLISDPIANAFGWTVSPGAQAKIGT